MLMFISFFIFVFLVILLIFIFCNVKLRRQNKNTAFKNLKAHFRINILKYLYAEFNYEINNNDKNNNSNT